MTQWGLAARQHNARGRSLSRGAAVVTALSVVVLWLSCSANAVAHPMQMRRMSTARQSSSVNQRPAKPRAGASRAHAANDSAKSTKGASVKSRQSSNGVAQSKATGPARKPAARSRTRHPKHPVQVDDQVLPVFHRASASRRRGHNSSLARPRVASTAADEPLPTPSSAVAQTTSTPLTVNDFLHAAKSPAPVVAAESGIVATGESHPDEDISTTAQRPAAVSAKPLQAKQPAVLARVEAAPAAPPRTPIELAAPSDLVAAPGLPAETSTHADAVDDSEGPAFRGPSRQELIAEVEQPMVLPGLYRNGRLVVPAPLRGTREILVHQNMMADDEGLQRVQDDSDLRRMRSTRQLIDFPESASLHVNPELASDRRCARPWAVRFASDVARAYYARFHEPLQVNSAVRTVAYQVRLRRVNGNAAGITGEAASPHLTGEALDFGKRGMSLQEIAWMRGYLLPLMRGGKLDVEEEFQQACFHISVYRAYLPASKRRAVVRSEEAQLREPRVPKIAPRVDQVQ